VDALLADNDDTRVGRFDHRKVDDETGVAPLPEEGELRVAWSLTLSSQQLGVIARIDVVEGDGGDGVVPIDYKKVHRGRMVSRGPVTRCRCACRR